MNSELLQALDMLEKEIDGVITNFPDLFLEVRREFTGK